MRTELRFLLAIVLMIAVLVATNLLFPPVPPPAPPEAVPGAAPALAPEAVPEAAPAVAPDTGIISLPAAPAREEPPPPSPEVREDTLVVESPLYRFAFSQRGARLVSAELLRFASFTREGPVQLLHPESGGALGPRILVGRDTLDLRSLPFQAEPPQGLVLSEDDEPRTLHLVYRHPTHPFAFEATYTFHPMDYVVEVKGRVTGVDARVLFTELGTGLAFNEQRVQEEIRTSAYVVNHLQQGIRAQPLQKVRGIRIEEGPFVWAAFKSKYFVMALLAGDGTGASEQYLGGVIAREVPQENQAALEVTQSLTVDGTFSFRLFMGPQEFARLANLGTDMENVNPYGWRFFRPIIRPFVGIIMTVLVFLHEKLSLGYGWVLIVFGVLMRVVLYPLNQKAMKAQMRNMAVQPLLKEVQAKHKDNPEKLQKEMMKLYKEHGFNPMAGCLPMLLPWPVLIALFFVFQNTIELRGVPFLWLPDLSAPDPFYILPAFLGVSMFLLQWVTMRSMPEQNPQMKMMMWIMPIMMVVIFLNLASGLNLYYSTANVATLPQQILIARERKKVQARGPLTLSK